MRAYLRISFVVKLAIICLVLGLVVGMWLSTVIDVSESQPSQPARAPTTQVADALPGRC